MTQSKHLLGRAVENHENPVIHILSNSLTTLPLDTTEILTMSLNA
jgi:hypothetical protein